MFEYMIAREMENTTTHTCRDYCLRVLFTPVKDAGSLQIELTRRITLITSMPLTLNNSKWLTIQ